VALIGALLYDPGTSQGPKKESIRQVELSTDEFDRKYEYFDSQGSKIEAWLYTPTHTRSPPIVIMAHGIGMQKHFQLDHIAEEFARKGLAVLVFDYRHFGGSEGEPRNLIKVSKQIADWHAAIRHVATLKGINNHKIALWGTSFSGGHVVTVASEQIAKKNTNITCVVSQIPFFDSLDAITHSKNSFDLLLKQTAVAIKDLVLSFFGNDQYIPCFGNRSTLAVLNVENPTESLDALGAKDGKFGWYNLVPARTLLEIVLYRPHMYASGVTVPTLIVYAEDDELVSAAQVEKTAATIPDNTLLKVKGKHFDVYTNEKAIAKEAEFLVKHLL